LNRVEIIPVSGLPIVKQGDNVAELICTATTKQGTPIKNGDIIVITHVFVSRAEGRIINLDTITPSEFALTVAKQFDKDPALVEVILQQSKGIIRMQDGKLITESKQGVVCANSGVDRSNVPSERNVVLLPEDADRSAQNIRREIKRLTGCNVAVVISDTNGRPLRLGEINVAIGVAGFKPIRDRRGEKDLFGYTLRVKQTAVADEFASAAELVIGQADEGIPVAIIRGYKFQESETGRATELTRPKEKDLFI
jgi:coenzyme F420-0:L-glutamate ligase/coenzyme F420-1:gamma-L-glutamate ligase